jgi:hypothetical protein
MVPPIELFFKTLFEIKMPDLKSVIFKPLRLTLTITNANANGDKVQHAIYFSK